MLNKKNMLKIALSLNSKSFQIVFNFRNKSANLRTYTTTLAKMSTHDLVKYTQVLIFHLLQVHLAYLN